MYLVETTEIYRVDSEGEANSIIAAAKRDLIAELVKFTTEKKEIKAKGEVVEEYYKVTLRKRFTDIKDPYRSVAISYYEGPNENMEEDE